MSREEILLQNWQDVKISIEQAARSARRNVQDITLLAVTKYAKDEDVLTLLRRGVLSDIGESRVQQAWARWHDNPAFAAYTQVKKHFIGHLQKNKAAKAAVLFDYIDSLDDFQTARAVSIHAPTGKMIRGLVQVKLTDKPTQSGLPLGQARVLAKELRGAFNNLDVCGYMAVAAQGADEETLRGSFREVYQAFKEDFKGVSQAQLSLGMSEDFAIAVQEGSTLPRIGSLLFDRHLEGTDDY